MISDDDGIILGTVQIVSECHKCYNPTIDQHFFYPEHLPHCPRCGRHGSQSAYGNFCTACGNEMRGASDYQGHFPIRGSAADKRVVQQKPHPVVVYVAIVMFILAISLLVGLINSLIH